MKGGKMGRQKILVLTMVFLLGITSVIIAMNIKGNTIFTNAVDDGSSGNAKISTQDKDGVDRVRIIANFKDMVDEEGTVFEGWLVDTETGYKLSLGAFTPRTNGRASLRFSQNMVSIEIYDKIVITREAINDADPNPDTVILEADMPLSIMGKFEYMAELSGYGENPDVLTNGTGVGTFVIDTANNMLYYNISYENLEGTETGAHIHGYENFGDDAPVVFALPPGTPKEGVWNYNESDEAGLLDEKAYVNIHSDLYPDGEIRGQIVMI